MRTPTLKSIIALGMSVAMAAAGGAGAAEIYKWTDENGNVTYGDRPADRAAQQVAIASRPTDRGQVQAMVRERREQRSEAREAAAEQRAAEPTPAELRAEREERARQCDSARAELQKLVQSRRIYKLDESGERVYYDEQGMQDVRAKAQSRVEEYCSS